MALTQSTSVSDVAAKVVAQIARTSAQASAFMPGSPGAPFLRTKDITGEKTLAAMFPETSSLVAVSQTETQDFGDSDWQTFGITGTTIAATYEGVPALFPKRTLKNADEDMFADFVYENGVALADAVDVSVCSLLNGFATNNVVSASGDNLLLANLLEANRILDAVKAPISRVCVIHTDQWAGIVTANAMFRDISQSGDIAYSVLRTYRTFTDPVLGWTWIISPHVQAASGYADNWCGSVFAYGALGIVWSRFPFIDTQEDISRGAGGSYEWIGGIEFGAGELKDIYGVRLISKTGAPA